MEVSVSDWARFLSQYGSVGLSVCLIVAVITMWRELIKLNNKIIDLQNNRVEDAQKVIPALERNTAAMLELTEVGRGRTQIVSEFFEQTRSRLDLAVKLSESSLETSKHYVSEYQVYREYVRGKIEEVINSLRDIEAAIGTLQASIGSLRDGIQVAISEFRIGPRRQR